MFVGTTILIIVICLLFSAFFSGMEIAFISSNKMHIELEKKQGSTVAKLISKLGENPRKFITTMLVGNNIALVLYTIYMKNFLEPYLLDFSNLSMFWNDFIIIIISTLIILVLAEFFPKSIFNIYSNQLLLFFAIPVYIIYIAFSLITEFVMWISNFILKLFGEQEEQEEQAFDRKDLEFYISEQIEGVEEEKLDSEIQIFQNALEFNDIKARECMIPRKEMIALELETPLEEVAQKFIETGLSKIIIYRDSIDNAIGYVHSFELFKRPEHIKNILLPVEFVHETTTAKDVMNRLTKKRKSIAIVLDEYGGTSGLVTVEDVVEELFGEIEDEHDRITLTEKQTGEDEYVFSTRLEIDYLNNEYSLDLPESETYETLGGLIMSIAESIPEEGEEVKTESFTFIIKKVSDARLDEVQLIQHIIKND
ncbi:MAG: hemolysin family protein [Flavobacteriales bacterium]